MVYPIHPFVPSASILYPRRFQGVEKRCFGSERVSLLIEPLIRFFKSSQSSMDADSLRLMGRETNWFERSASIQYLK